jgi:hypothetical protein
MAFTELKLDPNRPRRSARVDYLAIANRTYLEEDAEAAVESVKAVKGGPRKRKSTAASNQGSAKSIKTASGSSPAKNTKANSPKRKASKAKPEKIAVSPIDSTRTGKGEASAVLTPPGPDEDETTTQKPTGGTGGEQDLGSELSDFDTVPSSPSDMGYTEHERSLIAAKAQAGATATPKLDVSMPAQQTSESLPTPVSPPSHPDAAASIDMPDASANTVDVQATETLPPTGLDISQPIEDGAMDIEAQKSNGPDLDTDDVFAPVKAAGEVTAPVKKSAAQKPATSRRRSAPSQRLGLDSAISEAVLDGVPPTSLIVTLKTKAVRLKKSIVPRTPSIKDSKSPEKEKVFKTPRTKTPRAKTPRAPASRKPARIMDAAAPPTAQEQQLKQEALDLEAQIDPEQLRISRKLTTRAPVAAKPATQGSPLVWADSRQALCETLPYFKMPQSGCHQNDGHVYAFLYDGASRCREYMDSDLIIGGAGGGMEADSTGQLVQKKNHTMEEAQVKAVLNDIEHKNPLVVICGNKSEGAICKMPFRYNVLDWFKPVAVWAEKTMGKRNKTWTTIKYRFERLSASSKPAWNAPKEISELSEEERMSVPPLVKQDCPHCSTNWPTIYLAGWICLNPDCDTFWKLPTGKDAPYGNLDYNPAFLLSRTEWAVETEPFSVRPPILNVGSTVGDDLTQINTRGMCCPKCGRCNSRRLFIGWQCDNPECDFTNFPKHILVKRALLHQPWEIFGEGPSLARNKHDRSQGVQLSVGFQHGFKVYRYTVPGVDGALVHLVSNKAINGLPGGADEMFEAMQQQDLHLERRRFGVEKMSGGKTEEAKSQVEPIRVDSASSPLTAESSLKQDGSDTTAETQQSLDASQTEQRAEPTPSTPTAMQIQPPPAAQAPDLGPGPVAEDGDFMTAFSMNYGMPYKFVASGASLAFAGSPWPVRAARADLNWASQNFLDPVGHQDLNEELIFGYMEGQKLEYHDDGEEGLGPRIATLSLGGKAKMHLRIKMKHYTGCSKTGLFTKQRPVPGSIAGKFEGKELTSQETYEKRLAAWEELQQLTGPAYNTRAKEIPIELGLYEKRMKKADDLVTVTLNHGDIVLMEGYEIQNYLEHKVVPEQCLRFALTCRTILDDHLKPEERPPYGAEPDEEGMSALRRMMVEGEQGLKEN